MSEMMALKSKLEGGDLVPVLIVGAIYGMLFALIVREVTGKWHRAETSDLITQSICLGGTFQREIDQFRKEEHDKANKAKKRQPVASAKSRSHKKAK